MSSSRSIHSVAVVIPVYLGEMTVESVVREVLRLTKVTTTQMGNTFRVSEIILVNDCGPDNSAAVIRKLANEFEMIHPVWLSRNFGQHAATIAGMAASSADWVVTLDEDGQHNPTDLSILIDTAINTRSSIVYARSLNRKSHTVYRNLTSSLAKKLSAVLSGTRGPLLFTSFRLISGELARSVAAYAGPSVYLDVALSWITSDVTAIEVEFREERRSRSGYSTRKLMSHFWKLALTTGTRPLRIVSLGGALTGLSGFALAVKIVFDRLVYGIQAQGWASVFVGILILGGAVLISVGIIAEYLGLVARGTLGQPTYLTIRDPYNSPPFGCGTDSEIQ
jgi:glycosyltransferase involved in cell wall biosynthesis